ncbi:UNKNOWN [Stylonychia lemnae]|uniref:Transmembrane protein n=1 Tax=Stylonychia lemnae TaxID=5949 RepID=A0A078AJZ9_STYLE|nr:UNKNOWN [Stylonychia lemnae]|eukprot:CDW81782.1 UNKNOWN [Stylonychia lemnae]
MRIIAKNLVLLLVSILFTARLVNSQLTDPDQTTKCRQECYNQYQNAFFCVHTRNEGYCCPQGNTSPECTEDRSKDVYCSSSIVEGKAFMEYTYCPRRTSVCQTSGSVLRPLLNKNQTVSVHQTMSLVNDDVCYWQFLIDPVAFQDSHPAVSLADVYINVIITGAANVVTYIAQGIRTNATNQTVNLLIQTAYKFALNQSTSVYLIAYPSSSSVEKPSLNFTYNITADYYPPGGMTIQLQAEIAPDVTRTALWYFLIITAVLGLAIILLVMFYICCKDFDPETDFEKRRKKLAKERKKKEKLAKKQKAKDEKSNKNSNKKQVDNQKKDDNKKKPAKKQDSYYDEDYGSYDEEVAKPTKKANAKQQPQAKQEQPKKKIKKSLETEMNVKDEKKQRKEQYKAPFLPDDDSDE